MAISGFDLKNLF